MARTKAVILTHGGAASPPTLSDGCEKAAEAGRAALEAGGDALAAALAATVVLEDDPRFNAGTGSNFRFDGETIEMDASAMASDGRFGGVGCIRAVRNPVLVAARLMETPHLLLVGEGATAFARRLGFAPYDPSTDKARTKHARALAQLAGRGDGTFEGAAAPWRRARPGTYWNFDAGPPDLGEGPPEEACDTVGAVVRDAEGRFAATASTGGTVYMLRGRVGDSPLLGCGVYAGGAGAVAATGVGEEITRRLLAKTVYDWLERGVSPEDAAARGLALFPPGVNVGLLVAGLDGEAVAASRSMAAHTLAV